MKVLLLGDQNTFVYDLQWGYKQIGCNVRISQNHRMKESLDKEIQEYKPDLIMTFGSPLYGIRRPEIMEYLGKRSGNVTYQYIHWDTDGWLNAKVHQYMLISKTYPDKIFTVCKEALAFYETKGFSGGIMRYGINPEVFHKVKANEKYKGMITYIANDYKGRMTDTRFYKGQSIDILYGGLIKNRIKVDLWGSAGMKDLYIIGRIKHQKIVIMEYVLILCLKMFMVAVI